MTAAEALTRRLGGDWCGSYGLVPGPGHSARDRSVNVVDGADGGVIVHSFAGEDWRMIREEWKRAGLLDEVVSRDTTLPAYGLRKGGRVIGNNFPSPGSSRRREVSQDDDRRTAKALEIWRASEPAARTVAESYLLARGIAVAPPPSLRFAPALKYGSSGVQLPAMVAAVQSADRRIVAIHRTYLDTRGDRKAQVSQPRRALGPITGGAVRLAHAGDTLALTEGMEDALALMQMTDAPAWAVLGTSGFKNFQPPAGVQTIVLAPDADPAGDRTIAEASARFSGMGLRVLRLRPPEGQDWNDILLDFEERAAIRKHDGGQNGAEADLAAFAETIDGRFDHGS